MDFQVLGGNSVSAWLCSASVPVFRWAPFARSFPDISFSWSLSHRIVQLHCTHNRWRGFLHGHRTGKLVWLYTQQIQFAILLVMQKKIHWKVFPPLKKCVREVNNTAGYFKNHSLFSILFNCFDYSTRMFTFEKGCCCIHVLLAAARCTFKMLNIHKNATITYITSRMQYERANSLFHSVRLISSTSIEMYRRAMHSRGVYISGRLPLYPFRNIIQLRFSFRLRFGE